MEVAARAACADPSVGYKDYALPVCHVFVLLTTTIIKDIPHVFAQFSGLAATLSPQ